MYILQIMNFLGKLGAKCEMVRNWYWDEFEKSDTENWRLTQEEYKLFSTMERFHSLSHTRYKFWFYNKFKFSNNIASFMPKIVEFFSAKKNGLPTSLLLAANFQLKKQWSWIKT